MIGAKAKEVYEAQAKERQAHGSTAPGRPKTLTTTVPEAISGETRAIIGKVVGVGGSSIDRASRVLKHGAPF